MTNHIVGGLADGKTPEDIAKKHKVKLDKINAAIAKGIEVEYEHTNDKAKAREITMDHLMESPDYYDKLEDVEASMEKSLIAPPDFDASADLSPKQMIEHSKKHDAVANHLATTGDKENAAHHRKQAQLYYQSAIKIQKDEMELQTPDGGIVRMPEGKEPLMKPVAKSLVDRWDLIKAAIPIDANQAFMSADEPEEEDQPQEDQEAPSGDDHEPQRTDETQSLDPDHLDAIHAAVPDAQDADADTASEQPDSQVDTEQLSDEDLAAIEQALKEQGHSDSEIAYILHGHLPPQATIEDHKMANEQAGGEQKREHQQNFHDVELDHKKKMFELEQKKKQSELAALDPDLEREHAKKLKELEFEKAKKQLEADDHEGEKAHKQKLRDLELQMKQEEMAAKSGKHRLAHEQRLMDLEFEKAKLEMEIDLDIKRKEAELKLKQKEAILKQSTKEKQEIQSIKHEQNKATAAQPEDAKE